MSDVIEIPGEHFHAMIAVPKPTGRLAIGGGVFVECLGPLPGRWRRFWMRRLLGWRWEAVEKI